MCLPIVALQAKPQRWNEGDLLRRHRKQKSPQEYHRHADATTICSVSWEGPRCTSTLSPFGDSQLVITWGLIRTQTKRGTTQPRKESTKDSTTTTNRTYQTRHPTLLPWQGLAGKAYLDEFTIEQYCCVVAEGAAREVDANASVGDAAQGCKSQTCKGEGFARLIHWNSGTRRHPFSTTPVLGGSPARVPVLASAGGRGGWVPPLPPSLPFVGGTDALRLIGVLL
jgi:hypothetical protein